MLKPGEYAYYKLNNERVQILADDAGIGKTIGFGRQNGGRQ
jgi:hypothetical protein